MKKEETPKIDAKSDVKSDAKNETKPERPTSAVAAADAKSEEAAALAAALRARVEADLPLDAFVLDPKNRKIDESSPDFVEFLDSVRIWGVIVPVQAQKRIDGRVDMIDGERRWRGATSAGHKTLRTNIWPETMTRAQIIAAALVISTQHKPHGCLDIARKLRQLKNESGLVQEQLTDRTGIPRDRVAAYSSLFEASDQLFAFFEADSVPLYVAVEMMRYEKALGEVPARRLIQSYREEPLTVRAIRSLRKKAEPKGEDDGKEPASSKRALFPVAKVVKAYQKSPEVVRAELEQLAEKLGFRVVPVATPKDTVKPGVATPGS
jgi:ParB family chromosome partitioning protein